MRLNSMASGADATARRSRRRTDRPGAAGHVLPARLPRGMYANPR